MPKVAVIGQGDCIGFELTIYNQQDKVRVIFQAYIEDITWLRGHTKCPRGHVISSIYHITTNEIPGELSRENLISLHVKTTCYLQT